MCGSVVFAVLAVLTYSFTGCSSQTGVLCPSVLDRPSCVCNHEKGVIDLSPLASSGTAPIPMYWIAELLVYVCWVDVFVFRFENIRDPEEGNYTLFYSYNPCYPFTTLTCENSYVRKNCQSVRYCTWELLKSYSSFVLYQLISGLHPTA